MFRVRSILGLSSVLILAAIAGCSSSSGSGDSPSPADGGFDGASPDAEPAADGGSDAPTQGCAPKPGFDSAVDLGTAGLQYAHSSMVLGAHDAPMIAFIAYPQDSSAAELRFVAYDAATCAWKPSVAVATKLGAITTNVPHREVSLARDAATGELAIAYYTTTSATDTLELAHSKDDGATWTSEELRTTKHTFRNPVVALGAGATHVLFWEGFSLSGSGSNDSDDSAYRYLSRTGAGAFTDGGLLVSPVINKGADSIPGALALDSANVPAFVYLSHNDDTQNLEVRFWRPGKDPVKLFDSQGTQNDGPSTDIAFDGTKPRVVATLARSVGSNGRDLWFTASDDGATWSAPLQLPQDGDDSMENFVSIAVAGGGKMSVASRWLSSDGKHTCGGPKLSTATSLTDWTTCGADTAPASPDSIGAAGRYVTLKYASNGKRVLSFVYDGDATSLKRGIAVWREP